MQLSNTHEIAGFKAVQHLGLVSGSIVQSKHPGPDIMAGLKILIGGEIEGYTDLLIEARQKALSRMITQAEKLRAHAILNVCYSTCAISDGVTEVLVYGTAVSLEKI